MKIFQIIEDQLRKEPNYLTDDGKLKKWVVINKAQNFDEDLIGLLLENEETKKLLFKEIKGALVFNQSYFIEFLEQKNYLNDSYTKFKNKVGLTIDGKYLNQRNEVALVWPYKDCVLEGGQTKEEHKRDEIFFNEILAQDEITQLLEPKVLTNAKVYDKDGEQKFTKFNRDENGTIKDNLIIKGNNLLALHSLKKEFEGKIKLIYIDPPYNTGGDANVFTYNNSFNHSTWLTFMRNRLSIAKDFLTKDGFIAIAIDHYELAYLIALADEVFGVDNRIGIVSIVHNPEGRQNAKYFTATNEFCVVYRKSELSKFNSVFLQENYKESFDINKLYNLKDENGIYKEESFIRLGGGNASLRLNKKNCWYPIYVSPDLKDFSLEKKEGYEEIFPITDIGQERTWKLISKSTEEKIKNNDIYAKRIEGKIKIFEKYRIDKGSPITTNWINKKYNAKRYGTTILESIFNEKLFSYPKSLFSVKDTIKIMTKADDLILDFHAGSGTTAHAVIELNKEDNGERKFILVEQLKEHINVCNERVIKVIDNENLDVSFTYFELKKYNEEFIERIQEANITNDLINIWEEMKLRSFLNYNIDIKKQEEHIEDFKKLELKEQKQHLFDILDKNQLYVNLSSLEDKDIACTEEEKQLTKDFYKIENKNE